MTSPIIAVYSPDSALASPRVMLRDMLRDLISSRELAWHLALRDVRAQYRQTYLGFVWAFVVPLANTAIWILLSRSGIVSVSEPGLPYPLYVFVGTMLWSILIEAMNAPLLQTNAARSMLAKLNFPREALVVSGIYQTLFNAGIKVAVLIGVLMFLGLGSVSAILLAPLGILSLVLVGTSIGVLMTPIGMLYADIGRAMPLLMQFLMYLSPVVFPMPKSGWAAILFEINPLTPIIVTARQWMTAGATEFLGYFLLVNVAAAALLVLVWMAYRLAIPILIERMSA